MRLKQTADFAVSLSQDTKSIKDLPQGVESLTEEKKQSILKSLVSQAAKCIMRQDGHVLT